MARTIGFSEFYEFMYRACSSFVHFKPGILLRTVWYDNQNVGNISISNFNRYYWDFSSFYGVYQFLVLYKEFKSIIDINNILTSEIDILKESFKSRHFPEVITFEELNITRPKTKWTVVNLFEEPTIRIELQLITKFSCGTECRARKQCCTEPSVV